MKPTFLMLAATCALSLTLSGCGSDLGLLVVNDYDVPVQVVSKATGVKLMEIEPHGASWCRNVVPHLGSTPLELKVLNAAGAELELRQITKAEADQNLVDNRMIVVNVGKGQRLVYQPGLRI